MPSYYNTRQRARARDRWEKLRKYAFGIGKQAVIDAAVGNAIGGPAGAASGAIGGAYQGYKDTDASLQKINNIASSRTMASSNNVNRKRRTKRKGKKGYKKRAPKKYIKKRRNSGKRITISKLIKEGISVSYEKRKVVSTPLAEALFIGHTSMPSKLCGINMWRALFKYVFMKAGVYLKDYSILMTDVGCKIGDVIRVNYYTTPTATTVTQVPHTVSATNTFDFISYTFDNYFSGKSLGDVSEDRIDSIEYIPYDGGGVFANASSIARTNVEVNTLKITVSTQSLLKIQNLTVEKTADNEAIDVNRVPLTGKQFVTKGNNVMKKINSIIIPGLFATNNDDAIYAAWTKQSIQSTNDLEYMDNTTTGQTVFFKPSEPPKKQEFQNCISEKPCSIGPGEITASKLSSYYTFSVLFYFQLLYKSGAAKGAAMNYDSRLGKTKGFYLEKLVGRAPSAENDINMNVELELKQSAMVHGPYGEYTVPIQYQIDY